MRPQVSAEYDPGYPLVIDYYYYYYLRYDLSLFEVWCGMGIAEGGGSSCAVPEV